MNSSEKVIEAKLTNGIKALGGLCIKLLSFYIKGLPDRLCLLPGAKVLFIELKSTGKTESKMQILIRNKLIGLGFTVLVIDNLESVKKLLLELQNNLK